MSLVYIVKNDPSFNVAAASSQLEAELGVTLTKLKEGRLSTHTGALFAPDGTLDNQKVKAVILSGKYDFDVFCAESFPTLKQKVLVCLDMDMTSVQIEGIDEIARRLGVFDEVAAITLEAMRGGLDFAQSLVRRVSMLKGGDANVIEDVKKIMTETPGLDKLMETVTEHGWVRGICSGGFEQLICVLEKKYNLDLVCANSLEIRDGLLTGRVDKRIVDAKVKLEGVLGLKEKAAVADSQVIVIGDGANDLMMIDAAALGIAYHAKPLVQQQAPFCINHSDLCAVALLLELNS